MIKLKHKYLKIVLGYLKPYKFLIVLSFLIIGAYQGTCLIIPNIMSKIVDVGINQKGYTDVNLMNSVTSSEEILSNQTSYILRQGMAMLAVSFLGAILAICLGYLMSKISAKIASDLRKSIYNKIMNFSPAQMSEIPVSTLITRLVSDSETVQEFLLSINNFIMSFILILGGTIAAIKKSPSMNWMLAVLAVVSFGIIYLTFKMVFPFIENSKILGDRFNLIIKERLSGFITVKIFNNENFEHDKFKKCNSELLNTSLKINKLMSCTVPILTLLLNIANIYIIWNGAIEISEFHVQVGDIMAYMQYIMMIIMSFIMMAVKFTKIPEAWISVKRVCEILDKPTEKQNIKSSQDIPDMKGKIEFKNVCFKYFGAEENVLKNINFTVNSGEKIGVIGTIGSGKSTLVKLISGLYEPCSGEILYDNKHMPGLTALKFVSYMPQNAPLFMGSLKYNMKIANADATDEEIYQALEDAQLSNFVKKYGTAKNIYGSNLTVSGGERQRLGIARSLLKNASIYIFDDSFANLDFKTDLNLRKNILSRLEGRTVFLISQRVSTVRNLDKIIVLKDGELIGFDSHENLLKNCLVYKEIVRLQMGEEV